MDRRTCLPVVLVLGCAQGSLGDPGFGVPQATVTQGVSVGAGSGDSSSGGGGTEEGSAEGSGDASASQPDGTTSFDATGDSGGESTAGETGESGPPGESGESGVAESSSSAGGDDAPPPPDAAAWESCEAAGCEAGADCITVTGLRANDAFCSPQCVTDLDCPDPGSGDALAFCGLIADDAVEPTHCALLCEYDGLDYGACPNGMVCAAIPGQVTPISLCMW